MARCTSELSHGRIRTVVVVRLAGLGGDGHARGDGETDVAHLRKVGALAAEQHFHALVAIGALLGEHVHVLNNTHG
eukprot:3079610-Pyramimonas_sp.AAC.2